MVEVSATRVNEIEPALVLCAIEKIWLELSPGTCHQGVINGPSAMRQEVIKAPSRRHQGVVERIWL